MNYKCFMRLKLSYIHTKSCCNDFEIGSLVGNRQSAKIELQQQENGPFDPGKYSNLGVVQLKVKFMRERSWASEAWSERPLPSSSLSPVEVEMEEAVAVERGGPLHPP